ncbi:MAG: creatininase family protein [Chloroflexota bacterium]
MPESRGDPASTKVLMEEMTWTEIRQAIHAGKDTAILATAAMEQHGPHLPTGTDTYMGYAIAEGMARKLGNALVAPVLRPGLSDHHKGFPGTITLRPETFTMLMEDYCDSLADHGFKHIAMFSAHGGNSDMMLAHYPALARRVVGRAEVFLLSGTEDGRSKTRAYLDSLNVSRAHAGAHCGLTETSMMLVAQGDKVRMDLAEPGLADEAFYEPANIKKSQLQSFIYGVKSQSPNGILGDPTGSNEEIGRTLIELRTNDMASELDALLKKEIAA